jgi:hypothetical protein
MIEASVNTDAIKRALGLYAQAMKNKTQPYIVNRMLRNVAAHAVRLTEKANRAKIAWTLGKVADEVVVLERQEKLRADGTKRVYYKRTGQFARKPKERKMKFGGYTDRGYGS